MTNRTHRLIRTLASAGRILAAVTTIIAAGTALAGLIIVNQTSNRLTRQLDEKIVAEARTAAVALGVLSPAQIEQFTAETLSRDTALLTVATDGTFPTVLPAGRGSALRPVPELPPPAELRARLGQPFTARAVEGGLEYRVLPTRLDEDLLLVIAAPTDEIEETLAALVRTVAVTAGVSISAIVVLVAVVTVASRRPVDRMIATAEAIGDGDLTARIDDPRPSRDAHRLAEALNHMLDRLAISARDRDRSEAALRDFVANASHELRTPLTSIRGYAEMLRVGSAADAETVARATQRIESEAERMGRLLDELLLLARLDQHPELDIAAVDLGRVLTDVVTDASRTTTHAVTHALSTDAVTVVGDEDRLRQAIGNLVANAVTHTPPGTTVHVALMTTDDSAEIAVVDDGPGIAPNAAHHIFERFWRPEEARSRRNGGTGLGLAIAASIASAHDGDLRVATTPGGGATFTLTIPLHGPSRSAVP